MIRLTHAGAVPRLRAMAAGEDFEHFDEDELTQPDPLTAVWPNATVGIERLQGRKKRLLSDARASQASLRAGRITPEKAAQLLADINRQLAAIKVRLAEYRTQLKGRN